MRKRLYIWLPTAMIVAGAIGFVVGTKITAKRMRTTAIMTLAEKVLQNKFGYTVELVKHYYVDSLNVDSLADVLLPELVEMLDPHSAYIPAELMQRVNEPLEGNFDGVGIVFNMSTDTVVVLNVVPRAPAYKVGIRAGDRIVTIGGRPVAGQSIPSDSIMKLLRGPRGTKVNVEVARQGIRDRIPFTITRDKIPIKSIDAAFMIEPLVGFIKLTTFSRTTYQEFVTAMTELSKAGMKTLILDLRGNTGGYFDQAYAMANEFLSKNELIVYTQYRDGTQNKIYANGNGAYPDLPLIVLIDEESASSSEIVAGALQDNDRAAIIGRRSFGKGLVQQPFSYSDGSELRLTVARYYTPTGRSIQKPYTLGEGDKYREELWGRYDELFRVDSAMFARGEKFTTPGGRTVYGGGGIMPDIFVPADTTGITDYYRQVLGRNILYRYSMEWVDTHRAQVNGLKTIAGLQEMLDGDPALLDNFIAYAARNGVAAVRSQIYRSERLLTALLRGYIGRNTPLEDAGFYANYYIVDTAILRALEYAEH